MREGEICIGNKGKKETYDEEGGNAQESQGRREEEGRKWDDGWVKEYVERIQVFLKGAKKCEERNIRAGGEIERLGVEGKIGEMMDAKGINGIND